MWYFVVFQPSKCRKTHFQPQIWSIWPIFPIDSESLPKVCYINWKTQKIWVNSEFPSRVGPLAPTHQIITQIFWTKSESTPACLSGNLSFIVQICDTLRFTPSVSSWIKHRSTLFIDLNMVMLCQSSMTRSWVVQRSCAGGRVWLSSLWQQKLLVGGTVLGRGRSRNSTTSGVVGQFCCNAAILGNRVPNFPLPQVDGLH